MELAVTCVMQIAVMFMLVAVGFLCGKKNIIDKATNSKLSSFVLTIVNPTLIFMSYQSDYDSEKLQGLLYAFMLSLGFYIVTTIGVTLLYGKKKDDHACIEKFAAVYSNCAFMGVPLISGLYGDEGVLYLTGFVTFFNIFVWTHGFIMFSGKSDKKAVLHAVTSPAVIAIVLGLICFALQIKLPSLVSDAATHIKNLNTPLAMIVAGVTISGINIKNDIKNIGIYRACFLRLIAAPIVFWAIFRWFDIPETVFMTVLVAAGCPVAATGTMFAHRFEKDPEFSSEIFAFSTVLSAITLPLLIILGLSF